MTITKTSIVLGALFLSGASLSAQSRNRVPPGQQPPAGECRVWYDDLPPGRQPRPMDCRTAETIASRDRSARVIYGSGTRETWGYGQYPSTRDGRTAPRSPNYGSGGSYYNNVAFNNGYTDGLEKGREDVTERRAYDPSRHSRYRSADHLYDRQYGSKDQYKSDYRQGFIDGYDSAFDRGSNVRIR